MLTGCWWMNFYHAHGDNMLGDVRATKEGAWSLVTSLDKLLTNLNTLLPLYCCRKKIWTTTLVSTDWFYHNTFRRLSKHQCLLVSSLIPFSFFQEGSSSLLPASLLTWTSTKQDEIIASLLLPKLLNSFPLQLTFTYLALIVFFLPWNDCSHP